MQYLSLNQYLKKQFGQKVYKIAINGGFTCPTRDGSIDTRGCIFCSAHGSGDFSGRPTQSITEQIEQGKSKVSAKMPRNQKNLYIAYFQAFTNTYAPVHQLERIFFEAIRHPDIVALSIGTRPDCLPPDVLELLSELNKIKPIWIELGLQTIHERSAAYIRRGYELSVYDEAVSQLRDRQIETITHVILGLPGESRDDMLKTVRYVGNSGVQGIKLQLLHVLKGTDLADDYLAGLFSCMEMDEYVNLICDCLRILPNDMVIHRMTGDAPKKDLIAPKWSADKKRVLNALNMAIRLIP